MVDLETIKLLEDLREDIANAELDLQTKRAAIGDALMQEAAQDFIEHFSSHGFITSETPDGATAKYKKAIFTLTFKKPSESVGNHADVILTPPEQSQNERITAVVLRSSGTFRSSSAPLNKDDRKHLEKTLAELKSDLSQPDPVFSFLVQSDVVGQSKKYGRYADLLMDYYRP